MARINMDKMFKFDVNNSLKNNLFHPISRPESKTGQRIIRKIYQIGGDNWQDQVTRE